MHSVLVAGAGRVGNYFLVGDGDQTLIGDGGDVERGFIGGFVEGWEGAARIRSFKL